MAFLDPADLPVWLDPAPLVREMLKRHSHLPVREPFAKHLKSMDIVLTPEQRRNEEAALRAAALSEVGRMGAAVLQRRAKEEMELLGETMDQRKKRQKQESQRRLRIERSAGKPEYSAKGNGARWRVIL